MSCNWTLRRCFSHALLLLILLLFFIGCNGNLLCCHGVVERNRISSLQSHGKALEKECRLPGVFRDSGDTPTNLLCELNGHLMPCTSCFYGRWVEDVCAGPQFRYYYYYYYYYVVVCFICRCVACAGQRAVQRAAQAAQEGQAGRQEEIGRKSPALTVTVACVKTLGPQRHEDNVIILNNTHKCSYL